MRSVWSFWSKPWREHSGWSWLSEKHHLLAWILSFETARKHYTKTSLVTDDAGVKMLVNGLGLPFGIVSTALNALSGHDPTFWMLGKLYAYREQREPFVHLDTDVFLWKRLPAELECAPVFAQNPQYFSQGGGHPKIYEVLRLLREQTHGWIPKEWEWALSFGSPQRSESCGIMGGNHIDFIHYYSDSAIKLVEDPRNETGWSSVGNKFDYNTAVEEYHLAACVDFHRNRPDSPYREVGIRYVFDSFAQAFNPNIAAKLGFTHLLVEAKRKKVLAERLEQRVKRDYPKQYERCIHFTSQSATG